MADFLDSLRNGAKGAERLADEMHRFAWRLNRRARPLNEMGWRLEQVLKRVRAFTDRYDGDGTTRRPSRSWR